MEAKYSKTKFEGYTHRFKVEFEIGEPYHISIDIYSNSGSYDELEKFLNKKKAENVISFKIVNKSCKKQDDITTKFIIEMLKEC